MATTRLLILTFLAALAVPEIGRSQPPTAPAPRPAAAQIHNLTWSYGDMRTLTAVEFEVWVRQLPADNLTVILAALKAQRGELLKKEALVQERLKAREREKAGESK